LDFRAIQSIVYLMGNGMTIVGSKSRVSEILNRKRKLTIEMIRNFHKTLHIPIESLFLDYKTNCA